VDEISELFAKMQAAWKEGDAHKFAAVFADHSRFIAFDGAVLMGAKEISAYHAIPFATHLAKTELRFGPLDIKEVADRVYIVASEGGIVSGQRATEELIGQSAQTFVIKRQEGGLSVSWCSKTTRVRPIDGPAAALVWKRFDEDWARLAS
jgi:uncharacterized protein (TIGR02246 family)